jgi:hypothetical protein
VHIVLNDIKNAVVCLLLLIKVRFQLFGLDAEEQYIAANLKEHLRDHALFTGFAPIENPKIAI